MLEDHTAAEERLRRRVVEDRALAWRDAGDAGRKLRPAGRKRRRNKSPRATHLHAAAYRFVGRRDGDPVHVADFKRRAHRLVGASDDDLVAAGVELYDVVRLARATDAEPLALPDGVVPEARVAAENAPLSSSVSPE